MKPVILILSPGLYPQTAVILSDVAVVVVELNGNQAYELFDQDHNTETKRFSVGQSSFALTVLSLFSYFTIKTMTTRAK